MAYLPISRSGAGTLAELVKIGVPAVLVPYPHAADNHQAANAQEFASAGAGCVLEESELGSLTATVLGIVTDEARLMDLRTNVGHLGLSSTLDLMFNDIASIAQGGRDHQTTHPWMAAA